VDTITLDEHRSGFKGAGDTDPDKVAGKSGRVAQVARTSGRRLDVRVNGDSLLVTAKRRRWVLFLDGHDLTALRYALRGLLGDAKRFEDALRVAERALLRELFDETGGPSMKRLRAGTSLDVVRVVASACRRHRSLGSVLARALHDDAPPAAA